MRFNSQYAYSKTVMPLWGHLLGFADLLFNHTAKKFSYTKKHLYYGGLSSVA